MIIVANQTITREMLNSVGICNGYEKPIPKGRVFKTELSASKTSYWIRRKNMPIFIYRKEWFDIVQP